MAARTTRHRGYGGVAQAGSISAGSRLLQASKAQLLRGTRDADPYDALSPRQRELVGANGGENARRSHRRKKHAAAPPQPPKYVKLAVSTDGVLETADALPMLHEMKFSSNDGSEPADPEPSQPTKPSQPNRIGDDTVPPLRSQSFTEREPRKRRVQNQASKPLYRSISLEQKLHGYEKTRAQLDELAAATGVRKDSFSDAIVVQVGEKCQLYSRDVGAWVSGKVVASKPNGEVCVQWEESVPLSPRSPRSPKSAFSAEDGGSTPRPTSPKVTREQWVLQSSSEFRRAGKGSSASVNQATKDTASIVDQKKSELQQKQEAQQRKLAPPEKKRARQALLRGPGERSPALLKALVAWTWTADLFHGLKDKERKLLCQEADFQVTPENDVLMTVGETVSAIHVVVKGECAIYTMRPDPQKIMAKVAKVDPKHPMVQQQIDLKSKFESMQRRASVGIRAGPSGDSANGKVPKMMTAAQRRQSVAMAVGTDVEMGTEQQDTLHDLKEPAHQQSRRGSIAVRRDSFAVAPVRRDSFAVAPARRNSLAVGPSANLPKDGTLFPIQMVFEEGDALGVQRAIHNITPELVQKQGYLFADHTVMALSEVTTMVFTKPEHIEMIQRAYHINLEEKAKLLSKVPSYAQYPQESLRSMAKFCRRLWYKSGECVVNQADEAEHVLYISAGQCRIVKDIGAPEERTLCVLRRAACMGDCAFFEATILYFPRTKPGCREQSTKNFTATIDQVLLSKLLLTTQEKTKEDEVDANSASTKARATALNRAPSPIAEGSGEEDGPGVDAQFRLITRKEMRQAAAQM